MNSFQSPGNCDLRPSDALTLAVRTGSPICAAEEVVDIAGVAVPEDVDIGL